MKNNPCINPIQTFWPKPSALAAALLLLTTLAFQPLAHGSGGDQLQITENSSSSLTVTWNGLSSGVTVVNTSADNWTVTLPVQVLLNNAEADPGIAIPEPNPKDGWNNVYQTTPATGALPSFSSTVFVTSDSAILGNYGSGVNGMAGAAGNALGTPDVPLTLTFTDLGDGTTSTAPDGASTALLALPAILALFAMARLRKSPVSV